LAGCATNEGTGRGQRRTAAWTLEPDGTPDFVNGKWL
jgi:hypothetical protein